MADGLNGGRVKGVRFARTEAGECAKKNGGGDSVRQIQTVPPRAVGHRRIRKSSVGWILC